MLFTFLYRNLKGFRLLVLIAILVTFMQVGSDILAATPLKFITSKVSNPAADPACIYPFLDAPLTFIDQSFIVRTLQGNETKIESLKCPTSSGEKASQTPSYRHSVIGVVAFSVLVLMIFSTLSAFFAYIDLFLSSFIAQNLSARLQKQLFEHLQRLSLDWHGQQKKGDLVQRVTGNIADIQKLVTDGLVDLLAGILTILGVAGIMLTVSPQYTLLSLCIAPLLFLVVITYTKTIKAATKKQAKAAEALPVSPTEDITPLPAFRPLRWKSARHSVFGATWASSR